MYYKLLLQLHDYKKEYDTALEIVNKGLEIDEKYADLGLLKAKILKHQNKLDEAAEVMEFFRQTDLADRFLNNKATKYYLRCNKIEKATELIGMFTKKDVDINVDLYTMQVVWFEYELACSYLRLNNYVMALKKFHALVDHFNQFIDDQFDFFAYCVRKSNILQYYNVLLYNLQLCKLLDETYKNPYYIKAILGCAKCYLYLSEQYI